MQDSKLCYTTENCKYSEKVLFMLYPAKCPDLKPIESIFNTMGDNVMRRKPTTLTEWWRPCRRNWAKSHQNKNPVVGDAQK